MTLFALQTEIPVNNLRKVINFRNSIGDCEALGEEPISMSVTECGPEGMLGVYDPDPLQVFLQSIKPSSSLPYSVHTMNIHEFQLENLLLANSKGDFSGNLTGGTSYEFGAMRRRLLATSSVPSSNFTGILNPVVCLTYGAIMWFSVTNEYYLVYDK